MDCLLNKISIYQLKKKLERKYGKLKEGEYENI
jgi:hypothetical protein